MDHKQLIEAYTKSLDDAVNSHKQLIMDSQTQLEKTLATARDELASLVSAEAGVVEKPAPESAWVKDHLVLNRQAVELFSGLFDVVGELVTELQKMTRK